MYCLRKFVILSVVILISLTVMAFPATSVADEHCDENSCVQSRSNNIHIENNNANVNKNENVQVVEIERPEEEVITVTEGGTPIYEEIAVIAETPPTGIEQTSIIVSMAAGLLGVAIRKHQNRFTSKFTC